MPIITIEQHQECYKEFERKFVSPFSKVAEQMKVRLYKQIISTGFVENTKKKPIVVFYQLSDGTEIPKEKWTHGMIQSAQQYVLDYPVPDAGKQYSILGKIILLLAGIAVVGAFAAVFVIFYFYGPEQKKGYEEFTSLPKVGDKYYGSLMISSDEYRSDLNHGWIHVIAVNPLDSIVSYSPGSDLGAFTFETLQVNHNSFQPKVLKGKFSIGNQSQIKIISADKKNRFESTVLSGKTKNYKIPAK